MLPLPVNVKMFLVFFPMVCNQVHMGPINASYDPRDSKLRIKPGKIIVFGNDGNFFIKEIYNYVLCTSKYQIKGRKKYT